MNCPNCRDTGLFPLVVAAIGDRLPRAICPCPAGDRVAAMLAPASGQPRTPPAVEVMHLRSPGGARCGAAYRYAYPEADTRGLHLMATTMGKPEVVTASGQPVCKACIDAAPPCARCGQAWRDHVEGDPGRCPEGYTPAAAWTPADPARFTARTVRDRPFVPAQGRFIPLPRDAEAHQIVTPSKEQEEARARLRACGRGISALKTIGNPLEEFRAEQALHAAAYSFVRTSDKAFIGVPGPCDADFADALDAYARALREAVSTRGACAESDATATTRKAVFRHWDQRHLPHFSSRGLRWFMPLLRKALGLTEHADLLTIVKTAEALAREKASWGGVDVKVANLAALGERDGWLYFLSGTSVIRTRDQLHWEVVAPPDDVEWHQRAKEPTLPTPPMRPWEGRRCHVCRDGVFKRGFTANATILCSACGTTPPSRLPRTNEPRVLTLGAHNSYVPVARVAEVQERRPGDPPAGGCPPDCTGADCRGGDMPCGRDG